MVQFTVRVMQLDNRQGYMIEYRGECIEIEQKEGEVLIDLLQVCRKIVGREI